MKGSDFGRKAIIANMNKETGLPPVEGLLGGVSQVNLEANESIAEFLKRTKQEIDAHQAQQKEESVFQEAERIIGGNRQGDYGPPERCNGNIADQWNLYIFQKYNVVTNLTFEDVCWMMADLKKVRQMNKHKRDNLVDAVGYIGMVDLI